jgi:leucyl aminopeptidase
MELKISFKKQAEKNIFILLNETKFSNDLVTLIPQGLIKELKKVKSELKLNFGHSTQIINSTISQEGQKVFIVGTKTKTKIKNNELKLLGYKIAKTVKDFKLKKFSIITDQFNSKQLAEIFLGIESGNYKFDNFISNPKKKSHRYEEVNFITQNNPKELKEILTQANHLADSINLVKDLVNTPSLSMTPTTLESLAKKIANNSKKIKFKSFGEKEIQKHKLNLLYSVGMGSGQESKLIFLEYLNGPKNEKPIMLVGKGVTFDAGGLNLKMTNFIENMKTDMAGAATVLGFFELLTKIDLPLNIIGIIPSVENLLGHNAYKPGDILTAYNGKTVEITNTDAEGRLILADAISYGIKEYDPSSIVDLATLTGACIVALGYTRTGLITNSRKLFKQFWKAAKKTGDTIWPLPLDQYHRDKVAGDIADYKNWTGGVNAGAIMGGAFIEKFVQKKPWVHLDIAGSSHVDNQIGHYEKGATGRPLSLLVEFMQNQISKKTK